ncbi:MAG: hypothetical protein LAP21_18385, partial [Acidobacteriia bacterium]|nr:hypothetical protein [Terriglobia bacterium]
MSIPTGLFGPHSLTSTGVAAAMKGTTGPGAYALGKLGDDGLFYINYVGRSDDDLAGRLQDHTPEYYPQFMYAFYQSMKDAFDKECHLYHAFKPRDNKVHPARPTNAMWACPV